MAAIPWEVASRISAVFPFPPKFYDTARDILMGSDGLSLLIQFLVVTGNNHKGLNPMAAYCVTKNILFRTAQFWKLVEFIPQKDFIQGRVQYGESGAPFSERSLRYAQDIFSKAGLLIKLRLPQSQAVTPMYGINWLTLLHNLNYRWSKTIEDETGEFKGRAQSLMSLYAQKRLLIVLEYLDDFEPMFQCIQNQMEKGPIKDIEVFVQKLKNCRTSGDGHFDEELKEKLRNCRVKKKDLLPNKWCELNGQHSS
ncbi:hypothetical protein ACFL4N_04185 [Thermodesulfobacteriota bacterium]